jgi:hypothetical protein
MQQSLMLLTPARPALRLRRALQIAGALGLVALAFAASTTGCSSSTYCEGGFVRDVPGKTEGDCEALCQDSACIADNVCVNNQCELTCTSHLDCNIGTQGCTNTTTDSGFPIAVCQNTDLAAIGTKCPFGVECETITACPDGTACDFTQCGGGTCTQDPVACSTADAGPSPSCNTGKCADGTACVVPGCAQADCTALACVSDGSADADAFCTLIDCHANSDCAPGMYCALEHDPHAVCNSNPQVGNNQFCGTTTAKCVDPATADAAGATYVEGAYCLLRDRCERRGDCAPCATDIDCSLVPGQHCTTYGGASVCTPDCNQDSDCLLDHTCVMGECQEKFGACKGTGKFCEPCLNDLDCGGKSSGNACIGLGAGQRACYPIVTPPTCNSSADCPMTPDGHHAQCLNAEIGYPNSEPDYGTCLAQFNAATNGYSCWCWGTGSPCERDVECCNGTCVGGAYDPNNEENDVQGQCN